jgi:hypothetical protein
MKRGRERFYPRPIDHLILQLFRNGFSLRDGLNPPFAHTHIGGAKEILLAVGT